MRRPSLIITLVLFLPVIAYLLYGIILNRVHALPATILAISIAGSLLIILNTGTKASKR